MRCPFCANLESQVKDSRPSEDGSSIRRRRMCPECGSRFTTFERVQLREVSVIKSDGREVSFDREKLIKSVNLATRKRGISLERIEKIVSSIQRQIETSGESSINSKEIGDLVLEALSTLDTVSYVRFASVYKNFKNKKDFNDFISQINGEFVSNVYEVIHENKTDAKKEDTNKKIKDSLF